MSEFSFYFKNKIIASGPDALGNFCVFCENICHHFRDTSEPDEFFSHQILSSITKLHRRRRPVLEQDKFLSGVKTIQILQFARHDLKKKFLSAPTITKLKIWQRQNFVEIFGRAKQILTVQCVRTLVEHTPGL